MLRVVLSEAEVRLLQAAVGAGTNGETLLPDTTMLHRKAYMP